MGFDKASSNLKTKENREKIVKEEKVNKDSSFKVLTESEIKQIRIEKYEFAL